MGLALDAPVRHRFTRSEYYALADAGLFVNDVQVELVAGDLIHHPLPTPLHASVVMHLSNWLVPALLDRGIVGVHHPVTFGDDTEPNVDVTVAVYQADFYCRAHPEPSQILLAVEVAEASARYDHEVKVPLFGISGIQELWLVDLVTNTLEVYRQPSADGYRSLLRLKAGDQVSPLAFPDLKLDVAALLPPTEHGN